MINMVIACFNDGIKPVNFKIRKIVIPETAEEEAWLSRQGFSNSAKSA